MLDRVLSPCWEHLRFNSSLSNRVVREGGSVSAPTAPSQTASSERGAAPSRQQLPLKPRRQRGGQRPRVNSSLSNRVVREGGSAFTEQDSAHTTRTSNLRAFLPRSHHTMREEDNYTGSALRRWNSHVNEALLKLFPRDLNLHTMKLAAHPERRPPTASYSRIVLGV